MSSPTPAEYENLRAQFYDMLDENRRLIAMQPNSQRTTQLVVAIVIMAGLTIASVVAIQIVRPDRDNTQVETMLIGITAPILIALLGAVVQQVHLAVNSRLTQLLELTAVASRAKGALQATKEADVTAAAVAVATTAIAAAAPAVPAPVPVVAAPVLVIAPPKEPS